jgi:glycosyltransferase involved in cell wall biosynthesis
MDLPVHTVTYSRLAQYLFNKSAVKNIQNIMQPLQADVIFVHKQSDFKMVREALGTAVKIIGVIHSFNAKYIEHTDTLVAVSEPVKQYLIASNYKGDVLVIPNMVNITTNPSYKDIPEIPLIGTMGVFRRNKNFHILIQSLSILKSRGVPFRAVIAGEGRAKLELIYLRWKYGLSNDLTIRGWVSNKERDNFLDELDLFVLCSTKETFGMVVIEAMARMKRVIATICGGPEHIITHGKDGYLINSGDSKLLANQITDIIQCSQEIDKIPNNALKTVTNNYSTEAVSKILQKLIQLTST